MEEEELLTPERVSSALNLSPATLANWRSRGAGPRYVKLAGKSIRYRRGDLDRWLRAERWSR